MTYEEVKKAVTALIANPETAQTEAMDLLKRLEEDYTSLTSLQTKSAEDAERIRTLQDTNQRLFLMQTGQVDTSDDETPELEGTEAVDAFINDLMTKEQ